MDKKKQQEIDARKAKKKADFDAFLKRKKAEREGRMQSELL